MTNCPYCGQQNPGTNMFCSKCGANLFQATSTNYLQQTPPTPIVKKKIKWWAILGIISGVSSIICGVILSLLTSDVFMTYTSYNGDFYTDTSMQLWELGLHLKNIATILAFGLSSILGVVGWFIICYFTGKLISKK